MLPYCYCYIVDIPRCLVSSFLNYLLITMINCYPLLKGNTKIRKTFLFIIITKMDYWIHTDISDNISYRLH